MFVFLCARAKLHQQERALKLCSATLNHCINTNSVNYKHYALYQFYKPHNYKEQKLHFLARFRGCMQMPELILEKLYKTLLPVWNSRSIS